MGTSSQECCFFHPGFRPGSKSALQKAAESFCFPWHAAGSKLPQHHRCQPHGLGPSSAHFGAGSVPVWWPGDLWCRGSTLVSPGLGHIHPFAVPALLCSGWHRAGPNPCSFPGVGTQRGGAGGHRMVLGAWPCLQGPGGDIGLQQKGGQPGTGWPGHGSRRRWVTAQHHGDGSVGAPSPKHGGAATFILWDAADPGAWLRRDGAAGSPSPSSSRVGAFCFTAHENGAGIVRGAT